MAYLCTRSFWKMAVRPNNARESMLQTLFRMIRQEPAIRSCINRLANSCCQNSVVFMEDKHKIAPTLQRHLDAQMATFFRDAVEMCFACGFVAYIVRRKKGLPYFTVLPLGSFTWCVEENSNKRDPRPLVYKVLYKSGAVAENEIKVVEYIAPRQTDFAEELSSSPIAHLVRLFVIRERQLLQIDESNQWNSAKHLAVTEKIDLKDPTTSGLQLLDELRRYNLSGVHSNMTDSAMRLKTNRNETLATANEGTFAWVRSVFEKDDAKAADVHLMPPNTEITELGPMNTDQFVQYTQDLYSRAVYTFFDMPGHADLSGSKSAGSSEQMSRHQHMTIGSMTSFLQRLAQHAYGTAFDVDEENVVCKMTPIPRMEIRDMSDLKTLFEIGVISQGDANKMRANYLE